jgi:hypothetical protein
MCARPVRILCLWLFLAAPVFAQQSTTSLPLDPSQLPARTTFYLVWRGAPVGEVRRNNALMSLWDDPDSAPLRNSMLESLLSDEKKPKDKPALTREELNSYASLLDNPFVLGYLARPASMAPAKPTKPAAPATSTTAAATTPKWEGMFFIYDRSGKEEILTKAILRLRSADTTDIPKLSNLTMAGVSALKIERKSSVTYWAETGKYAVSANEQAVFEEILNRLSAKSSPHSLADSAVYQEAKPLLGAGILEFFLNISQFVELAGESATADPRAAALLKAIKLDSIHLVAGHLSLEGPRTRMQGAILGNTATGSLFDIWADGKATPSVLSFLSANTVSLNESDINLLGIYKVLKQALIDSPSGLQIAAALESAAQTRLGMPLTDALALPTGEIASIQNSATLDSTQQVRIMGIHNKPEAMKLLRTIMGEKITSERTEGTTTFMKVSLGGGQGSAGVAQWNFYHLAMTPDLLLGGSKSESIRALLEQPVASPDAAFSAKILAARKQFPDKLNGFSYFDFQKVQWKAMTDKWLEEAKADAAKAATANATGTSAKAKNTAAANKKLTDWLANVNPDVFPRHLHIMTGASWKDSTGLHFDEWMD